MVKDKRDYVIECCGMKNFLNCEQLKDYLKTVLTPTDIMMPEKKIVEINLYWYVFTRTVEPLWWDANMGFTRKEET